MGIMIQVIYILPILTTILEVTTMDGTELRLSDPTDSQEGKQTQELQRESILEETMKRNCLEAMGIEAEAMVAAINPDPELMLF